MKVRWWVMLVLSVGAEVWIDQMKKILEGVSWIRSADGALQAVGTDRRRFEAVVISQVEKDCYLLQAASNHLTLVSNQNWSHSDLNVFVIYYATTQCLPTSLIQLHRKFKALGGDLK